MFGMFRTNSASIYTSIYVLIYYAGGIYGY